MVALGTVRLGVSRGHEYPPRTAPEARGPAPTTSWASRGGIVTRRGANEGTICQRSDGRWEARVLVTTSDGHRVRRSFLGQTRPTVRQKLGEALRAEAAGRPTLSNRLTVGAFLGQWLEDSVRPSTRPSTYASYSSIVRLHLEPGLGHLPLARLSPQQVQTFLNAQSAAGLSARSVTMERAVLRQALGRAERWGLVSRNVAKLVDPPRVARRQITPFSPEQARAFLEIIREDRL